MKIVMILLLSITSMAACKKDKTDEVAPAIYVEENPLSGFLATTGLDQQSTVTNNINFYEEGFSFKASVKGTIRALTIKLPAILNTVRITIWDSTSKAILRTENINIPTANIETVIPITVFNIEKNKAYLITMSTKNDYLRRRNNNSIIPYPIVSGSIIITNVYYGNNASQLFTAYTTNTSYYGDISFKFLRTE